MERTHPSGYVLCPLTLPSPLHSIPYMWPKWSFYNWKSDPTSQRFKNIHCFPLLLGYNSNSSTSPRPCSRAPSFHCNPVLPSLCPCSHQPSCIRIPTVRPSSLIDMPPSLPFSSTLILRWGQFKHLFLKRAFPDFLRLDYVSLLPSEAQTTRVLNSIMLLFLNICTASRLHVLRRHTSCLADSCSPCL